MNHTPERSRAEVRLAAAVLAALDSLPAGAEVNPQPASEICICLEWYIPEVLARTHLEWSGESFDSVYVARGAKVGSRRLRLLGTGILMTDQRVTPLLVEIEASPSGDAVDGFTVRVGEPGEGPLQISGPPCNSGAATRLLHRLPGREELGRVNWVYRATSDDAEL